jgi:peptidoglycan/xylan/chitin deacetylase (PgdA/CDA1 family)
VPHKTVTPAARRWIKRGALAAGHYARALRRSAFPGVAVLNYHGLRPDVSRTQRAPFDNLHVLASTFESHCRMLREICEPISLDMWRAAIAGGRPLPPGAALITFDDGYRSVFTIAAPILAKYRMPAVVFACSAPISERRLLWFDYIAAREGEAAVAEWKHRPYAEWRRACADAAPIVDDDDPRALMTPLDISRLARQDGIEIGAHTARHPILAQATAAEQREEIVSNRDALEAWSGRPVRAFAYPNGRPGLDYTSETVTAVRDAGFDVAFTTNPSFATANDAPLERSRFLIVSEVTAPELAHRLAYAWPR